MIDVNDQHNTVTKMMARTVVVEYFSLLDAEQSQLWHTGRKDHQCSFSHCRLVQAELSQAGWG